MKKLDKDLYRVRELLGVNFHLTIIYDENIENHVGWYLYYGNNDPNFYFSKYCKSIMNYKDNSIDELVDFAIKYSNGLIAYGSGGFTHE